MCFYDVLFKMCCVSGALRLHTEMELDLPLSPCNDEPPDLFLPDGPLSPEQLSPVYKQ